MTAITETQRLAYQEYDRALRDGRLVRPDACERCAGRTRATRFATESAAQAAGAARDAFLALGDGRVDRREAAAIEAALTAAGDSIAHALEAARQHREAGHA